MKLSRFLMLVLLAAPLLMAADSTGTRIQQSPEDLRATSTCQTGTFGTTQVVLTFPTPAGNCFWVIDTIDNGYGATTAPAATLLNTTSTGFASNWKGYATAPASATGVVDHYTFSNGLRALNGTPVTFTSNAAVTSINFALGACGHQVCL